MKCSDARALERLPECLQVASVRVSDAFERGLVIFAEKHNWCAASPPQTLAGISVSLYLSVFRLGTPSILSALSSFPPPTL